MQLVSVGQALVSKGKERGEEEGGREEGSLALWGFVYRTDYRNTRLKGTQESPWEPGWSPAPGPWG